MMLNLSLSRIPLCLSREYEISLSKWSFKSFTIAVLFVPKVKCHVSHNDASRSTLTQKRCLKCLPGREMVFKP